METIEAYLRRKYEELQLLDACLDNSLALTAPRSIDEVIALKFKLTAAIRAQHDLTDWTATETAWSGRKKSYDNPFSFRYDYQRADLEVAGPSFYDLGNDFKCETMYTSSGMASIAALLLASSHAFPRADILLLPGTYAETLEFIEAYARHLKIAFAGRVSEPPSAVASILFLDSVALAKDVETCLRSFWTNFDFCIFDTSCLAGSSGKIVRVLRKARREGVPVVMVRSHTKLDSLGAEYGRLGSTTFVCHPNIDGWAGAPLRNLPDAMRNAVRLLGGAAVPAHFPPYVGSSKYRLLTGRRVAAMIRNGRRTVRFFRDTLGDRVGQMNSGGLYVTLKRSCPLDENAAREAASQMSLDLGKTGCPFRHAGSFGFDFGATEWVRDITGDFAVRIAVPDLPTEVWDHQTSEIARWWREHDGG